MSDDAYDDTTAGAAAPGLLAGLLRRSHLSPAHELGAIVAEEARSIGARRLVVHLIDYEQRLLVPVPAPDAEGRDPLSVQGTMAGRAFRTTAIVRDDGEDLHRVWLPLLDGTERIGVIEVTLAEAPSEAFVALLERYSHLVALLVVTKGAYSDFFELLRRRRPMTPASELLWNVTPPAVLATNDFVLGALLEPAYDMGGDAYDYALNGNLLHLAVFDAVGHGLAAAGMSTFALATYRNCRRNGLGLAETHAAVDAAVAAQYPETGFVTALLAQLDIGSGQLRWISAGHPPPLLLRGGRHIRSLETRPAPPAGAGLSSLDPVIGDESLEPGDVLALYTDGLTEARRPGGELFTTQRLGEFIAREASSGQAAPETLRRLREAIIGRGAGNLHDDATAMVVEWRRGTEREVLPETS